MTLKFEIKRSKNIKKKKSMYSKWLRISNWTKINSPISNSTKDTRKGLLKHTVTIKQRFTQISVLKNDQLLKSVCSHAYTQRMLLN